MRSWVQKPLGKALVGIAVLATAGAIVIPVTTGGGAAITCNQTAANAAGLATAVTAATTGQTVCLTANVDYGTFTGTNKAITLIAQTATGARSPSSPTLRIQFGSGDSGFTIDGNMSTWAAGMAGEGMMIWGPDGVDGAPMIVNGASNITLKNFRSSRAGFSQRRTWKIDPAPAEPANITINHAVFFDEGVGVDGDCDGTPSSGTSPSPCEATFYVWCSNATGSCDTGITLKNSLFQHSTLDGVKVSEDTKMNILNNKFINMHECLPSCFGNHTDVIQFNASNGTVVRGNVMNDNDQCISSFNGTSNNVVTHNALADCDVHALTMMADNPGSTVAHNTITSGNWNYISCANGATAPPIASTTSIYNNIASSVELTDTDETCVPTRNDHNSLDTTQTFVSGSSGSGNPGSGAGAIPTSWNLADFCIASGSELTGADDGGQQGVCGGDYNASTDGPRDELA